MNNFFVDDADNSSSKSILATTCSDEYIRNAHLINFSKIADTEEDPSFWNRKFKKNDWNHLYD